MLGYTRISRETEESTSLDTQQKAVEKLAARLGATVVHWVRDPSVSGALPPEERPGLGPYLRNPKLAEWDVIGALDSYRVGRDTVETLLFVRFLRGVGKRLVTDVDSMDTDDREKDFMLTVFSGLAEKERATTIRRVLTAREDLRSAGRHGAGPAPYGYRLERLPDGGWTRALDESAAEVVRECVERVISGWSIDRIVRDLNERSVPAPSSAARSRAGQVGRWHAGTLHRLLRGRAILGQSTHKGQVVTEDGLPVQFGPPVISPGTWQQLQEAMKAGGRAHARKHTPSLLYGLIRCSECEAAMVASGQRGRESYVCRTGGHSRSILRRVADRKVLEAVEMFRRLPVTIEEWETGEDHGPRITELNEAIDRLVDELAEGRITSKRARERMADRVEAYEREVEDLTAMQDLAGPRLVTIDTGRTWGQDFDDADTDGKRRLLASVLDVVWVGPHVVGLDSSDRVDIEADGEILIA